MRRIRIVMAVLAVALPAFAPAAVAGEGWYAALDLGYPQYKGLTDSSGPFKGGGAGNQQISGPHFSSRVGAGYQFNPYFGLEAAYVHLGQADDSTFLPGGCLFSNGKTICFGPTSGQQSVKTQGYLIGAVGTVPVDASWSFYAHLDWFRSHTSATNVSAFFAETAADRRTLATGIGVKWAYSQSLELRLGWDQYYGLGNSTYAYASDDTGQYDVDVLTIGLAYYF